MLSFCHVGHSYPVSLLTTFQAQLMHEFSQLGIIYHSRNSSKFYPTQIAVNIISIKKNSSNDSKIVQIKTNSSFSSSSTLSSIPASLSSKPPTSSTSSLASLSAPNISGLQLIIETNFQVVAYCTSELHFEMLRLFIDHRDMIRLPNMTLGQITRDSIKRALKIGITAQQIIDFMLIHSHPRVLNRNPIIPENVTDQIKLWEFERYRIKAQSSVFINLSEIFSGTELYQLYAKLKQYSQEINVLLWSDDNKKCLIVSIEGYHQLDAYSKSI